MKQQDDEARVKGYGKTQLAQMYYPDCSSLAARRKLQYDIEHYPGLLEKLQEQGWNGNCRYLTRNWVKLIFEALEPP